MAATKARREITDSSTGLSNTEPVTVEGYVYVPNAGIHAIVVTPDGRFVPVELSKLRKN